MSKKFWSIRNLSEDEGELELYGDISQVSWWEDDVSPATFSKDLKGLGNIRNLTVRINSGGGDVFAAQAIGNILEQHPANVTAKIDGLCASAATIIACHCNQVVAARDATYMIHPVQMGICDYMTAKDLEDCQKALSAIRDNIVKLYARKTGRECDEVGEWMDNTSWWTAEQAVDNGFIDSLVDDSPVQVEDRNGALFVNSVNMGMPFKDAPQFMQTVGVHQEPRLPVNDKAKEDKAMGETNIKTVDELRAAYPDLVKQIEDSAVSAERQRISEINEMQIPGCEDMAKDAMFTNPVSASTFAVNVMKQMKNQGAQYLKDAAGDAAGSGVNDIRNDAGQQGHDDEFMMALQKMNKKGV